MSRPIDRRFKRRTVKTIAVRAAAKAEQSRREIARGKDLSRDLESGRREWTSGGYRVNPLIQEDE